jgi:hypothetical protein
VIRGHKTLFFLASGFALIILIACFGLVVRYSSELRGLTLWRRAQMAAPLRHEKVAAQAWVYTDRTGDYLIFINENENDGPFSSHEWQKSRGQLYGRAARTRQAADIFWHPFTLVAGNALHIHGRVENSRNDLDAFLKIHSTSTRYPTTGRQGRPATGSYVGDSPLAWPTLAVPNGVFFCCACSALCLS